MGTWDIDLNDNITWPQQQEWKKDINVSSLRSSKPKAWSSACWQLLDTLSPLAFLVEGRKLQTRSGKALAVTESKAPLFQLQSCVLHPDSSSLSPGLTAALSGYNLSWTRQLENATAVHPVCGSHWAAHMVTSNCDASPGVTCSGRMFLASLTDQISVSQFHFFNVRLHAFPPVFLFVAFLFINQIGMTFPSPGALPSSECHQLSGH